MIPGEVADIRDLLMKEYNWDLKEAEAAGWAAYNSREREGL